MVAPPETAQAIDVIDRSLQQIMLARSTLGIVCIPGGVGRGIIRLEIIARLGVLIGYDGCPGVG